MTRNSLFAAATLAALGLAAQPATAQVVTQFNSPILTTTSPSGAETLVFSGLITNYGRASVHITSALIPSFILDAAGDTIALGFDQDLLASFTFAPGTMTPVNFIDASLSPGQAPGLYNIPPTGPPPSTLSLVFSDGEPTNTVFAVDVTPAAAPEPSQLAAFAVGLLGLGALALKAKKRQAA